MQSFSDGRAIYDMASYINLKGTWVTFSIKRNLKLIQYRATCIKFYRVVIILIIYQLHVATIRRPGIFDLCIMTDYWGPLVIVVGNIHIWIKEKYKGNLENQIFTENISFLV